MAVSISLSISQGSQSVTYNRTSVTVSVKCSCTYGSWNAAKRPGTLKIDGTSYSFSSAFNTGGATNWSGTLFTKTVYVYHNSDGTKKLSCSASFSTDVSSGTVTASASKTLTTIPRKSSMSVGNGTLGTAQTLSISRASSSFTHSITAKCGTSSTTIASKTTSTSVSFTPPLSWATKNTTGTSLSVTYTLTTYSGSTSLGSSSYTKTLTIPNKLSAPGITIAEPTGLAATYGGYVQGRSKLSAVISGSGYQSSTIKSYYTTVKDTITEASSSSSSFTTNLLSGTGSVTVATTITDSRGHSKSSSKAAPYSVLAYSPPKLTKMSVIRCNSAGTANSSGAYLKVTFSGSTSSLNSKNVNTYKVSYKKTSATTFTNVSLTAYNTVYSVTDGSYIFAADLSSSYDVQLTLNDKLTTSPVKMTRIGPSGNKVFSIYPKGLGWAFGKVAELAEYLDVAWRTRFRKNIVINNGTGADGSGVIYGEDPTTSSDIAAFQPQNENGDLVIGYGLYRRKTGNTNLYTGENIYMISGASSTSMMVLRGATGRAEMYRQNDIGLQLKHSTSGKGVGVGVGSGGNNRGIWDLTSGNWIIYRNSSDTTVTNTSSDARLKDNLGIISYDEMYALLTGMEPINFIYKNDDNKIVQNGFIAQNVRDILINNNIGYRPFLIIKDNTENDNKEDIYDLNANEEDVLYGIDYSKFTPLLVKGWQYHEQKIKELEDRVKELEERLGAD